MFFVLLSNNYIKSKYCLIELGFAYGRLVHSKHNIIRPYILPDGEGLLDGTPLRDLQYYPLLDERTIRGFVREVEDSDIEVLIRNDDIHSFIRRIRALYLMTTDIFNESASDRAVSEACSSWAVPTVG